MLWQAMLAMATLLLCLAHAMTALDLLQERTWNTTHIPLASACRRAAQEPENAHSHLLSMVLGNSETIPITKGELAIGTWQVGTYGVALEPFYLQLFSWALLWWSTTVCFVYNCSCWKFEMEALTTSVWASVSRLTSILWTD